MEYQELNTGAVVATGMPAENFDVRPHSLLGKVSMVEGSLLGKVSMVTRTGAGRRAEAEVAEMLLAAGLERRTN